MFLEVTARHHDPAVAGELPVLSIVRRACQMADALGFSVVLPLQPRSYQEILGQLPERERAKFPRESSEFIHHIASKINSLESA